VLGFVALAGCAGSSDAGEKASVESRLVGRSLEQIVIAPAPGRPLLVLLHGRSSSAAKLLDLGLEKELARLGKHAPAVVLVDGGDHSYYHDRADGRWGAYVIREAIPAAIRASKADGARVAIGGISMGGFGALDLARLYPSRFCAVGGHSAALWRKGGETPAGAFDDAADFARHDLFADPLRPGTRVWLDVGRDDPFHDAGVAYASLLRRNGADVQLHVWPGDHSSGYWRRHLRAYLAFYVDALAHCP
jgi:S-formylglutathione hydrolase FrmB